MFSRRLLALLFVSSSAVVAAAGCSHEVTEEDGAATGDAQGAPAGDGSRADDLVTERQLTGSDLPPKTLALTFDDGPGQRTAELAEYLDGKGIHATFFINGKNVPGRQNMLTAVKQHGHIIGNHTQNHLQLTSLPAAKVIEEVKETDDIIKQYQPDGPWIFRAPFGAWNGATARAVNSVDFGKKYTGSVFWNEGGQLTANAAADWDCWGKHISVQQCGALYLEEIRRNGHGIPLMHDIHNQTIDMVKEVILPALIADGWKFVTLPEVPQIARALAASGDATAPTETETQCASASVGHPVDENVCVQSHTDQKWYRCVAGDWQGSSPTDTKCTQKIGL
jgi:peptidoglycan/xylan/chitin deacetylase (PgdA/CDA1 family)